MPGILIEQSQKTISIDLAPAIKSMDRSTKDIVVGDMTPKDLQHIKNKVAIGLPIYENLPLERRRIMKIVRWS